MGESRGSMNEPWRIQLLGSLKAEQGARVICRFRTQQTGLLLGYLAYYHRPHPREVLVEALWPDAAAGRHQLSNALSSLRLQLEPPGVPAGAVIRADRYSVELNPDTTVTDFSNFQQELRAARRAENPLDQREHLARALDLVAGPLLPGYYADWIPLEQASLSEAYAHATRQLVRLLCSAGEAEQAIDYCRRALAVDPLREDLHRSLMQLLADRGEPTTALRQYRELERLLHSELGVAPDATTRRLREQIERTSQFRPLESTSSPPDTGAKDLAAQRQQEPRTLTFLLLDAETPPPSAGAGLGGPRDLTSISRTLRRFVSQRPEWLQGAEMNDAGGILHMAFPSATDALTIALKLQPSAEGQSLLAPPSVRMALYTGDVSPHGSLHDQVLDRARHLLTSGNPGQLLCSEATAVLLRRHPEGEALLRDLGCFRLSKQEPPERIFQVDPPGLAPSKFPNLRAVPAHSAVLPLQVSRFFGRPDDQTRLRELLFPAGSNECPLRRLVTLTGPGGVGKTRLAVEVAAALSDAHGGALWFVPLQDLPDGSEIAARIAAAMGLRPSRGEDPLDPICEALARQPSLLVLDTLEHLVEPGAELVGELLRRVPTLSLLVTSQRRLGVSGEQAFPVAPLALPEEGGTREQLAACESVQLFLDRAQAVRPDFQLTPTNSVAIARLCHRLEGIPLALELAAARAQVLTPAQMLTQLERRFDFLVARRRGGDERQRTLRGAIEWSFRLLAPELQRFFTRLCVFRGGWSAEAAADVCEEPLALDHLAQLEECSLLVTLSSEESIRFWSLDTLREYASERLDPTERGNLERRHAEYFTAVAEEALPRLTGPEGAEWLQHLAGDYENLRTALRWSLGADGDGGIALRLCGALVRFWVIRGHLAEGRSFCARALDFPEAQTLPLTRALVLRGAGLLACGQGDYEAAQVYHEAALPITQQFGDLGGEAAAWNGLGNVALGRSDYTVAFDIYGKARGLFRQAKDRRAEAISLGNMALIANVLGRYREAKDLVEQALIINRELGDGVGEAANLDNLGNAYLGLGETDLARSCFQQALERNRGLGNREWAGANLGHLAQIAWIEEDLDTARRYLQEALELAREVGHRRHEAESHLGLARVSVSTGEFDAALTALSCGLSLARLLGDRGLLARGLAEVAAVAASHGEAARAAHLWGAAASLREQAAAPLTPDEQERQSRSEDPCRSALGTVAYAVTYEEGRKLSIDEAFFLAFPTGRAGQPGSAAIHDHEIPPRIPR